MADQTNIEFTDRRVTIIPPTDTTEIMLRVMDWRRIYRHVKTINPLLSKRDLLAGISFGVTASGIFALISIYAADQVIASWVKPTVWSLTITSAIIGIVICFSGKRESENVESVKKEILKDMCDTHRMYFPDQDLDKLN